MKVELNQIDYGIHESGVGDGSDPVNGWISAGYLDGEVSEGNILPICGFEPCRQEVFKSGGLIQLTTITECFSYGVFKNPQAGKLKQFIVMGDYASNVYGKCYIKIWAPIFSDEKNPYKNISSPIPKGEKIMLAATHRVFVDNPKIIS